MIVLFLKKKKKSNLKVKTDVNPSISQCAHVTLFEFFLFLFLFFHIRGANWQSIWEAFDSTLCLVNLTCCAFWYNRMIFLPVKKKIVRTEFDYKFVKLQLSLKKKKKIATYF